MESTTQRVRTITATVEGGRTLEVSQYAAEADGTPVDLIISIGWSHEPGWRNRAGMVALPGSALSILRDVLDELGRE